jgi:hypothetical protein
VAQLTLSEFIPFAECKELLESATQLYSAHAATAFTPADYSQRISSATIAVTCIALAKEVSRSTPQLPLTCQQATTRSCHQCKLHKPTHKTVQCRSCSARYCAACLWNRYICLMYMCCSAHCVHRYGIRIVQCWKQQWHCLKCKKLCNCAACCRGQ